MHLEDWPISRIRPYDNNPRLNAAAKAPRPIAWRMRRCASSCLRRVPR
jgi:hypothetical protein